MRTGEWTMLTVFEATTADGWKRRCDETCHAAKLPRCRCVCQGINHGVGFNAALENTRECFEWLRELTFERTCGSAAGISAPTDQGLLFE